MNRKFTIAAAMIFMFATVGCASNPAVEKTPEQKVADNAHKALADQLNDTFVDMMREVEETGEPTQRVVMDDEFSLRMSPYAREQRKLHRQHASK